MHTLPLAIVPTVSANKMREIDALVVNNYDITLVQMMENAGRSLAELAIETFDTSSATVLVGSGHNGGGGLVAARHLFNRGVRVSVVLSRDQHITAVTRRQLSVVRTLGVPIEGEALESSLVIDALIGYSLNGEPYGRAAELIDWTHEQASPVLSLDVPSGLDATTGRVSTHCVYAAATLCLALVKTGVARAPGVGGELFLADISIPRNAYGVIGVEVPDLFSRSSIIRLAHDTTDANDDVEV